MGGNEVVLFSHEIIPANLIRWDFFPSIPLKDFMSGEIIVVPLWYVEYEITFE